MGAETPLDGLRRELGIAAARARMATTAVEGSPLLDAFDEIVRRAGEAVELKPFASRVGLSTFAFARIFKDLAGMKPGRLWDLARVDRLLVEVATTERPLEDIRGRAGYRVAQEAAYEVQEALGVPLVVVVALLRP